MTVTFCLADVSQPSGHQDLEATFSYDDAWLTNALNQLQAVSGADVVKVNAILNLTVQAT